MFKFEKFDDIDWQSYAQIIQEKYDVKKRLEETNDRVKALQERLKEVQKSLVSIEEQNKEKIRQQTRVTDKNEIKNRLF